MGLSSGATSAVNSVSGRDKEAATAKQSSLDIKRGQDDMRKNLRYRFGNDDTIRAGGASVLG